MLDLVEQRQSPETGAIISGGILAESLNPGTGFDGHGMRITRWTRFEVAGTADYQPPIWTLIEFEAPASSGDVLARELAGGLLSPGWYANWDSDTEATVIFPARSSATHAATKPGARKPWPTDVQSACPSRNSTGPTNWPPATGRSR